MISFNDRRTKFKNPSVEAAAMAGSIKAAENPKMVERKNISKVATRVFGQPVLGIKEKKTVVEGSKADKKLQKKSKWAAEYDKKQQAKYEKKRKAGK